MEYFSGKWRYKHRTMIYVVASLIGFLWFFFLFPSPVPFHSELSLLVCFSSRTRSRRQKMYRKLLRCIVVVCMLLLLKQIKMFFFFGDAHAHHMQMLFSTDCSRAKQTKKSRKFLRKFFLWQTEYLWMKQAKDEFYIPSQAGRNSARFFSVYEQWITERQKKFMLKRFVDRR